MQSFRVVLRSGANIDFAAECILDDPEYDVVYFFRDESRNVLAGSVQREQIAGLILLPDSRMSRALPRT